MSQGFEQADGEFASSTECAEAENWVGSLAAYTAQPSGYIRSEASSNPYIMPVDVRTNTSLPYMLSTQVTQPSSSWMDPECLASVYCNNGAPVQHLQPGDSGAAIRQTPIFSPNQFNSGNIINQAPHIEGRHLRQQSRIEPNRQVIENSVRTRLSPASGLSAPEGLSHRRSPSARRFPSRNHPYDRRPSSSHNQALSGRSLDNIGTNPADSVLYDLTGIASLHTTGGFPELAQNTATSH